MDAGRDTVQQVTWVLMAHEAADEDYLHCRCGRLFSAHDMAERWPDHARHVAEMLADDGLLADRERYVSLDMLRPGDYIVWTSGGRTEVRELFRANDYGDEWLLMFPGHPSATVNASLLVRRADPAGRQEQG